MNWFERKSAAWGFVYAASLTMLVVSARLGLVPGSGVVALDSGMFEHRYRIVMAAFVLVFAMGLGIYSGFVGRWQESRAWGFATLVAGGIVTGLVLEMAPWILYPHDRYPVTFMWVLAGGPLAFAGWGLTALVAERDGSTAV